MEIIFLSNYFIWRQNKPDLIQYRKQKILFSSYQSQYFHTLNFDRKDLLI